MIKKEIILIIIQIIKTLDLKMENNKNEVATGYLDKFKYNQFDISSISIFKVDTYSFGFNQKYARVLFNVDFLYIQSVIILFKLKILQILLKYIN